MSATASYPIRQTPEAGYQSASLVERGAVMIVGLLLPAVSVNPWGSAAHTFWGRATPVDFALLATLFLLLVSRTPIRIGGWAMGFLAALTLGLLIGVARAANDVELRTSATEMVALTAALLYYVLGRSVARSPALLRALVAGVAMGVMWEGVIVLHDYLFDADWFPDNEARRVRGTFRMNGQLAAYGFSTCGFLFCYGWMVCRKRSTQLMALAIALLPAFFVFAASRRSGIAALLLWLVLCLILGMRGSLKRVYPALLVVTIVGIGVLAWRWSTLADTFAMQRTEQAIDLLKSGESTMQVQARKAWDQLGDWFPLGVGVGRGFVIGAYDPNMITQHEIHNGHLAILVELGVLGIVMFYGLVSQPVFRKWNGSLGAATPAVRTLVIAFIIASAAFMLHNRLHRDRGFLLFLGVASSVAYPYAATAPRKAGYVVSTTRPGRRV